MNETGVKLCTRGWSPRSQSCVSPNTKSKPTKLSAAVWAGAARHCGSLKWLCPRFPAGSQPRVPLRESPPQGGLGTHGDRHAQKERTHGDGPQRRPPAPSSDLTLAEPRSACLTSGLCCQPGRWPASSPRCCRPHCCCRRDLGVRPSPRKEDEAWP